MESSENRSATASRYRYMYRAEQRRLVVRRGCALHCRHRLENNKAPAPPAAHFPRARNVRAPIYLFPLCLSLWCELSPVINGRVRSLVNGYFLYAVSPIMYRDIFETMNVSIVHIAEIRFMKIFWLYSAVGTLIKPAMAG